MMLLEIVHSPGHSLGDRFQSIHHKERIWDVTVLLVHQTGQQIILCVSFNTSREQLHEDTPQGKKPLVGEAGKRQKGKGLHFASP